MKKPLHILKIGGRLIEEEHTLDALLTQFAGWEEPKILVHGGGKEAGRLSARLGIPVKMHQGRRITDADTLKVVTMVYGGLFNKKLVSRLQALGCNALGLSGADGNSMLARRRTSSDVDYGLVGDVTRVNTDLISGLLGMGLVPVFCALSHDGQGQMLNTNADTIATEWAIGMAGTHSVRLTYCFDKPGVLADAEDDSSVIPALDLQGYQRMRESGAIHTGMLPKLENAFRALAHGVEAVRLGGIEAIHSHDSGTRIVP